MPLHSIGGLGAYPFMHEQVRFRMEDDDGHRVHCAVNEHALRLLDPERRDWDERGMLEAFEAYRREIEQIASSKYDDGRLANDGQTVIIREFDVGALRLDVPSLNG